jgi:3-hydroxyisobutyrate dehydrogenase-like beta-hydroxyacid dehydrogenase
MTKAGYDLGFVGLGRMGGPMVGRLLDAGHAVTVFDISEPAVGSVVERGAAPAGSAAEVAAAAEIVMTSLPNPDTDAKFGPDSDFTSIARVVEEWAGVEIRS